MTADIITGPWKKNNQSEKEMQKAQILAECDGIASDCMVSVLQILVENGMAYKNDLIKILGRGELTSKIDITVDAFSVSAKASIEKAGGKANIISTNVAE